MANYQIVYGDKEQVVRTTLDDVVLEHEDGWTVFFRGTNAILRVRDDHVQSLAMIEQEPRTDQDRRGLDALTVREVMRPPVMTVECDAHLAAAAYLINRSGDTALVVVGDLERRTPVAVITNTDIACAVADGKDPNQVRISELIRGEPITVSAGETVGSATALMASSHLTQVPVVNDGELVGMLDLTDACLALLGKTLATGRTRSSPSLTSTTH